MLKQAVKSHKATGAGGPATQQSLFSSQQRPVGQNGARPLSANSGNVQRTNGIKRTSSGLAKALGKENSFTNTAPLKSNSQANPIILDDPVSSGGVYFDENDFSSDIDLDVEEPSTKGSVTYPTLPPVQQPSAIPAVYPDLPQSSSHAKRDHHAARSPTTAPRHPQASSTVSPPQPPSSAALPWSSSPLDHFDAAPTAKNLKQFEYQGGSNSIETTKARDNDKPRPTKRRTLPWLQNEADNSETRPRAQRNLPWIDEDEDGGMAANTSASGKPYTPLPKNAKTKAYPWNTTASALKEQQKNLRQAKKSQVKTNEATEEGKAQAKEMKKKRTVHRVFLSEEQQHVLNLVVDGKKSVFFTGSAGTGKSVLLREIITALHKKYQREQDRVAVTASTGLAACNVGGVTLHSFAGIGLGKEDPEALIKKIRRNQKAKHRWQRTKVLVIDEVSMVDGELFDKLENIARVLRNNGRPFGGIQLVITGDFFQLPPVPDNNRAAKFAFDAATWNTSIEHTIALHHVFRQKDPVFANMLNEMREGRLSEESTKAFRALSRPLHFGDDMEATELFSTRAEVDQANNLRMNQLQGEVRVYDAKDGGSITEPTQRDRLLQNCMAPGAIQLKKGAQVMLIKNIDTTLVNGSLGKVVGFMNEQMFDRYHEDEEEYTNSKDGEIDGDALAAAAEKKPTKSRMDFMSAATSAQYPVVRFAIADGTTRDLLCQRESWKVELPNGEVQASRSQIPLILAWALSIHKAQGQTLERVKVNLRSVFEKGQAYVALSRATSMAGLQVLNFDPRKVNAHDRVRNFYRSLSRAEAASGTSGKKVTEKVLQKATRRSLDENEIADWEDERDMLEEEKRMFG